MGNGLPLAPSHFHTGNRFYSCTDEGQDEAIFLRGATVVDYPVILVDQNSCQQQRECFLLGPAKASELMQNSLAN